MRTRLALVAALSALVSAGCGATPPAVGLTSGYASPSTTYGRLLPRFTRETHLYDGFDTVAKGVATWRSPELRRAEVEASVERYRLGETEAAALRAEQEQVATSVREFHLALYTPMKHWNDLEEPDTLWRAYLELPDGKRLDPLEISFVRKTDKSSVEYPYVTPWTREYTLRFPLLGRQEPHSHLTLVITGVLGSLSFQY